MRTLSLTERRDSDLIDNGAWRSLSNDDEFWRLVDRKIIQVRNKRAGVVFRPNAFVGQAVCGDMRILIGSKIEGALEALISFASHRSFRIEAIRRSATEPGELTTLLIEAFLASAGRYLQTGMDFRYQPVTEEGTFIRGRLDLPRTLRLWAMGRPFHVAYVRQSRSRATQVNLLIGTALARVEQLSETMRASAAIRAQARGYLRAFPLEFQRIQDGRAVPEADELDVDRLVTRDAAELATAIHSASGFEPFASPLERTVPRSWFLNLETLFEQAVRNTLRDVERIGHVRDGKSMEKHVFPQSGIEELDVSPDLLIEGLAMKTVVGDVKYKDWTGNAAPSDIYQLLVHAASFNAEQAFLVYPGDGFERRDLGVSSVGIRVQLFSVRPTATDLRSDLSELVDALHPREVPVEVA